MATQPSGSNLLQQLEGCLREPNLTNHAWSQLVSYLLNSSIQCRKNSAWDQLVLLDYSQILNFPMLWARRGLVSWAQYYPQCLEKVQLERSVWSSKFSSFLEPDGVQLMQNEGMTQAGCTWCQSCACSELPICCKLPVSASIPSLSPQITTRFWLSTSVILCLWKHYICSNNQLYLF